MIPKSLSNQLKTGSKDCAKAIIVRAQRIQKLREYYKHAAKARCKGDGKGKARKATPSRNMGFAVVWDARLMLLNTRLKAPTVAAAPASQPVRACASPLGARKDRFGTTWMLFGAHGGHILARRAHPGSRVFHPQDHDFTDF